MTKMRAFGFCPLALNYFMRSIVRTHLVLLQLLPAVPGEHGDEEDQRTGNVRLSEDRKGDREYLAHSGGTYLYRLEFFPISQMPMEKVDKPSAPSFPSSSL